MKIIKENLNTLFYLKEYREIPFSVQINIVDYSDKERKKLEDATKSN